MKTNYWLKNKLLALLSFLQEVAFPLVSLIKKLTKFLTEFRQTGVCDEVVILLKQTSYTTFIYISTFTNDTKIEARMKCVGTVDYPIQKPHS